MDCYDAFCDDFFINLEVQTALPLPTERETVLQFCEACQKQFPDMASFYRRDTGEFILEGNREVGCYRWVEIDKRRLSSGFFNPPSISVALQQHRWILDRSKYFLGVSHLDIDCLDIVHGFNMDYAGNRDAIVAEALLGGSPLGTLVDETGYKPLGFEPSMIISLDEGCYQQARLSFETRCNSYQVRSGNYDNEPISIYFTVRGYPNPAQKFDMQAAFDQQAEKANEMTESLILPRIIQPIASAIASM